MRNRTTIKPPIPTPSGFRNFAFYTLHFDFSSLAPLHLSRVLYKSTLFMQNKANFRKSQMNVSIFSKMDYENIANWTLGENKPNSKPIKPKTNPIQTQYKAKTNPIKPNLVRRPVRRSPLINPCGTKTEALAKADSKGAPMLHILITSEQVITAVLQSRLALRYILRNPDIIPIPGLSHVQHVEIPL